jgi:hypothetical protein
VPHLLFTQGSAHAFGGSFNQFKPGLELLRDRLLLSDGGLIRNYSGREVMSAAGFGAPQKTFLFPW